MWTGQQDDNDEAVRIAHDYQVCQRAVGWDARECAEHAREAAREVAAEAAVTRTTRRRSRSPT
jgi:hypothetical protein